MSKYINPIEKFELFIKLNKLGINILKCLAESLSIEIIEDKNKLIDSIVKKFEDMNTENADKFERIIDDQLDETKTLITIDK